MSRRIVSLWFPKLASDRILRAQPIDSPFALIHTHKNTQKIYCLNIEAERQGLRKDMHLSDARALCSSLRTSSVMPEADADFLTTLMRWAKRYCPWVGYEEDGLVMDITGSAHLMGGEDLMLADIHNRLNRSRLNVKIGLADTRGAAWALARFATEERTAPQGQTLDYIGSLPVAALRIEPDISIGLQRLGLRTICDVASKPRNTLSRRFGPSLLMRLDQALGDLPEPITPSHDRLRFSARLTLPDPIGLLDDVTGVLLRLLHRICNKLAKHEKGARKLRLNIRKVDQADGQIEISLARPMRDVDRIAALFEKSLGEFDAGFGIDQMHLTVIEAEDLILHQTSYVHQNDSTEDTALVDLITRLGNRVGFDNITRVLPAQSHIPEKSFITASAAYSQAATDKSWSAVCPRPLIIFPPEIVTTDTSHLPEHFRWRRMHFTTDRAVGPERISPEWWLDDPSWRSGVRDYWRIHTKQGRRLWLFFTPQQPSWFVQGEFA